MNLARALGHEVGSSPMSDGTPIVFVVDDDVSVRESLELLIRIVTAFPNLEMRPLFFVATLLWETNLSKVNPVIALETKSAGLVKPPLLG